jgi:hypothetical protein
MDYKKDNDNKLSKERSPKTTGALNNRGHGNRNQANNQSWNKGSAQ